MIGGDARHPQTIAPPPQVARIGCVGFLNAKPLIEGLADDGQTFVRFDVPSALLAALEADEVDVALCPVIDYYRSRVPLNIVPAGGISSEGPTLTVRLFSRVPAPRIQHVLADHDSHTSVVLLQVLLAERYGIRPHIIDFEATHLASQKLADENCQAVMLIGDKVVTSPPPRAAFPYQIDLGQAWHQLTGLPFVFAVWMCLATADVRDLCARLKAVRRANTNTIDELVRRHAAAHGWPNNLAQRYLGQLLSYDLGQRHLEAIEHFAAMAAKLGLIDQPGPLRVIR